jgi:hypothetical protein
VSGPFPSVYGERRERVSTSDGWLGTEGSIMYRGLGMAGGGAVVRRGQAGRWVGGRGTARIRWPAAGRGETGRGLDAPVSGWPRLGQDRAGRARQCRAGWGAMKNLRDGSYSS